MVPKSYVQHNVCVLFKRFTVCHEMSDFHGLKNQLKIIIWYTTACIQAIPKSIRSKASPVKEFCELFEEMEQGLTQTNIIERKKTQKSKIK